MWFFYKTRRFLQSEIVVQMFCQFLSISVFLWELSYKIVKQKTLRETDYWPFCHSIEREFCHSRVQTVAHESNQKKSNNKNFPEAMKSVSQNYPISRNSQYMFLIDISGIHVRYEASFKIAMDWKKGKSSIFDKWYVCVLSSSHYTIFGRDFEQQYILAVHLANSSSFAEPTFTVAQSLCPVRYFQLGIIMS